MQSGITKQVNSNISVLIGLYFANKNKTMEDYMLGGRSQSLLPVSVSMMTSFISGLTIVGNPSEFFYYGWGHSTIKIPQLLSVPVTAFILLPVFHKMGKVSVYDVSMVYTRNSNNLRSK